MEQEYSELKFTPISKPQIDNHVLGRAILQLNFSPSVKITSHRYKDEVRNWSPPCDIFEAVPLPPENGFDLDQIEITEVSTATELKTMIEHLSQMAEWAVDVEHHDLHSYAGITCLIQISTAKKHFLVDPFKINREIKRDLKPLMESGSHVKVMHGSHNDLRWLQRDFDIFVWPVVDTQVICRKLDSLLKNDGASPNISLEDLIDCFFSLESQQDNFSTADFRIRPLPSHLKRYAIFDTIYLLPLILELRQEIELETDCNFIALTKDCAEYMTTKVALYKPKVYPSVHECMFKYQIGHDIASKFKSLFDWRNDKGKILDENPDCILGVYDIVNLIDAVTAPADISLIESFISYSRKTKYISKMDFAKIKEIIDTESYICLSVEEALFPCMSCGEYLHPPSFWPGGEQNCYARGSFYFEKHWTEKICVMLNKNPNSVDLELKNTKSNEIGLYSFTWKELNWFASEIRIYIKTVNRLLRCCMCLGIVKEAVIFDCLCLDQPVACKSCWMSICPICFGETSQDGDQIELKHLDHIHTQCKLFLKALKENYVENLFAAIMQFLFAIECELTCSYCYKPLSNPQLVPVNTKITPFCDTCSLLIRKPNQRFGFRVGQSFPTQLLDEITETFTMLLSKLHSHCKENEACRSNSLDLSSKSLSLNDNEDEGHKNDSTKYYYYRISNLIKIICLSSAVVVVSYIMCT